MAELKITKDNFEEEVMQSDMPVLLDFWADWCGPCRMLAPVIEELAGNYAGKIKVGKVNVDENPELAIAFDVASIPTIVILKNGKSVATSIGCKPLEQLTAIVDEAIG